MSRPTIESQYEQAERWMHHTFGSGMRDYTAANLSAPNSVAIVEVDRLVKASAIRQLIVGWRSEDVKSAAGAKPFVDETAALALILLQLRLERPTLITDMAKTFHKLSPRQRAVIGLRHDGKDACVYGRIGDAVKRLIALVDEFPGRRDKILSRDEFRAMIAGRDPADCRKRRERMFLLGNTLVEGTWKMLPREVRERWEGNIAQDATLVPLQGQRGNPAAHNLNERRRSINSDGGYYQRAGSHGAMTHSDAREANKASPGAKNKGTSIAKSTWGVEAELARLVPNLHDDPDLFPLITLGVSHHIPGAITGEGVRMLNSFVDRGHRPNHYIVDRAYPGGKFQEFHLPARLLGVKLVFDYKDKALGVQLHHTSGFVQVSGAWCLDNLPDVHRDADKVVLVARNKFDAEMNRIEKTNPTDAERAEGKGKAAKELAPAEELYEKQLAQRAKYMLTYKGHIQPDGSRRYIIPTDAPGYPKWKAQKGSHQSQTIVMTLPTAKEIKDDVNAGGLKNEQYFAYGTAPWKHAYGLRNGVESANRNVKRAQFEDIATPDKRGVRGNTFTYIVVAMSIVAENLRQMVSFFKRKLALKPIHSKNNYIPSLFWQSDNSVPAPEPGPRPPW